MGAKKLELKKSEFLSANIRRGDRIEITAGEENKIKVKGTVSRIDFNMLLGVPNAYGIQIGNNVAYAKMQVLGETLPDEKKEAVATAVLAGSEIWGKNDWLKGESGPILVRITLQRAIKSKDAKQYLRAAAIARTLPEVLKYKNITVTDLGPENVGTHPFDIYITSKRRGDLDRQIIRLKTVANYLQTFGEEGVRALVEVQKGKYRKRTKQLEGILKQYKETGTLGPRAYEIITKALLRVLHEYPKTEEFWKEWEKDRLEELKELRSMGVSGKTVENVEKYIKSIKRARDWRERIIHATVVHKNLAKLWFYALKRKGVIRSLLEERVRRPAGPPQRP